jgi:hypothetical protein
MQALDGALLSATLWNYSPDNTNRYGDGNRALMEP